MYSIRYTTKKGGSCLWSTSELKKLDQKVKWLFSKHIKATIYKHDQEIGKVWEESSKWNYSFEII